MITIIGGGIFGLSIAWSLLKAGVGVTLLEKDSVGHGATWAAAGMLMPWKLSDKFSDDLFALQRAAHTEWPAFATSIEQETGVDIDFRTDGRYFVAITEAAARRLERQYTFHQETGFDVEWLSGDEAREREPYLGPKVTAAVFSAMGYWVDNRQLVKALRAAIIRAGGTLREHTPVTEVLISGGQVEGLRLSNETLKTETVVLAAGAWIETIAGIPDPLRSVVHPRKGQLIILQQPANAPVIRQTLIGPVYMVPRSDERLIVGTTVEREAGFDTQSTAGGVLNILSKAQAMVPTIENFPILEMGAGLRPTGPNRLPVLGPTGVNGLFIAAGGHSYGILISPVIGPTLASLLINGEMAEIIAPFKPA